MAELDTVVDGADVIIICAPHQFVRGICKQLEASGKVGAGGRSPPILLRHRCNLSMAVRYLAA